MYSVLGHNVLSTKTRSIEFNSIQTLTIGDPIDAQLGQLRIGLVGGKHTPDPGHHPKVIGVATLSSIRLLHLGRHGPRHLVRRLETMLVPLARLGVPSGRPEPPRLGQVGPALGLPLPIGPRLERAAPPVEHQNDAPDLGPGQQTVDPVDDVAVDDGLGLGAALAGLDRFDQEVGAGVSGPVQPGRRVDGDGGGLEGGDVILAVGPLSLRTLGGDEEGFSALSRPLIPIGAG